MMAEVLVRMFQRRPKGSGPGLVVLQEIWGVNEHIRDVADRYAMDGFMVYAPDVFWRQQPRVDLGYNGIDTPKAFAFMTALDATNAAKDLGATAAARCVRTRRALARSPVSDSAWVVVCRLYALPTALWTPLCAITGWYSHHAGPGTGHQSAHVAALC